MIAIFGASVTQQKKGYAVKLKSKLEEKVKIYGYGGMHLSDAGICFLDNIIKERPRYCFLDWFTTGYLKSNDKTKEYLDTIIYKFSQVNCKLIFLFLPHRQHKEREKFYSFCKDHLKKRNVYFLDLYKEIKKRNISLDTILRDNVHTNDYGSELYASIIASYFEKVKDRLTIPSGLRPTKYTEIKRLKINKIFDKCVKIKGNAEIVGFLVTLGPHSGIIEIVNKDDVQRINTWDRWCHFPRKNFQFPMKINGEVQLNILQENFDTSECRVDFDFTKHRKKLVIHDIYYVGSHLQLLNINDGRRIPKEYLYFRKIAGRIYQYMKKLRYKN